MARPTPGSTLPDFTLPLATQDGRKEFKLHEHLGKGPVVIGFFPIAFSGICTQEMCDVRDRLPQLEGAQVFGFSTDTPFANAEFAKLHHLPQGIISDPNREVVERIWETMTVAGVQRVAKRGAMVLDAKGAVKWASVSDDPKVWVGAEEIRKHL